MPAHIDPLSTIPMPRNQRDRLRRGLNRAVKNIPAHLVVSLSADGYEIGPRTDSEPTDADIEAALDTITRELRR